MISRTINRSRQKVRSSDVLIRSLDQAQRDTGSRLMAGDPTVHGELSNPCSTEPETHINTISTIWLILCTCTVLILIITLLQNCTYHAEICISRPTSKPRCIVISSLNPCHLKCPFCWELSTDTSCYLLELCRAEDNFADILQSWGAVLVILEVLLVVHWVDEVATVTTSTFTVVKRSDVSHSVVDNRATRKNLWNEEFNVSVIIQNTV